MNKPKQRKRFVSYAENGAGSSSSWTDRDDFGHDLSGELDAVAGASCDPRSIGHLDERAGDLRRRAARTVGGPVARRGRSRGTRIGVCLRAIDHHRVDRSTGSHGTSTGPRNRSRNRPRASALRKARERRVWPFVDKDDGNFIPIEIEKRPAALAVSPRLPAVATKRDDVAVLAAAPGHRFAVLRETHIVIDRTILGETRVVLSSRLGETLFQDSGGAKVRSDRRDGPDVGRAAGDDDRNTCEADKESESSR